MSNKLFQSLIHQMSGATSRIIGVIDRNGLVVACSDLSLIGETRPETAEVVRYSHGISYFSDNYYSPIEQNGEHFAFAQGDDITTHDTAALIAVAMSEMKELYDDKYDATALIKNIILDNILPIDIYLKSKELHFSGDISRVVYLIKFEEIAFETSPYDIIKGLYGGESGDYIIAINENSIAMVRELDADGQDEKEIEQFGLNISATLGSELFIRTNIGIGSRVNNIKDLARSYKEAQIALEVGRVFAEEKGVCYYEDLGIGRLIYQLPMTLCDMFISEVFKKSPIEEIDRETLDTIYAFFDNNLNVSETSRQLFIHRNTLVYRIDKIHKLTGLDLRNFDHAITLKIALMIRKYMNSKYSPRQKPPQPQPQIES